MINSRLLLEINDVSSYNFFCEKRDVQSNRERMEIIDPFPKWWPKIQIS